MRQWLFSFLIITVFSNFCLAAKILLITDQDSLQKANEVKDKFMTTEPFSLMKDLKIIIRQVSKKDLVCTQPFLESAESLKGGSSPVAVQPVDSSMPESCKIRMQQANIDPEAARSLQNSARMMVCSYENLPSMMGKENADFSIFIKESDQYAGSGGDIVIISTQAPANAALHELLHRLGFGDEYEYESACEADTFCPDCVEGSWANLAIFPDKPPYISDADARKRHRRQIPWYGKIKRATLITTGSELGSSQKKVVGLFRGKTCDLSTNKLKTWKPGYEITVMETLEVSYIPKSYWPRISLLMNSAISGENGIVVKGASPTKAAEGAR